MNKQVASRTEMHQVPLSLVFISPWLSCQVEACISVYPSKPFSCLHSTSVMQQNIHSVCIVSAHSVILCSSECRPNAAKNTYTVLKLSGACCLGEMS